MRKKQIIKLTFFSLLLVAVILSFSFYGCTKATTAETAAAETTKAIETTKAAETTTAETKVVEPITISLFTQAPGAYPQIFPEIIKNYEAKHPGVTVDMRVVGYGEYMASLATMIAAGEAPDVFLENQGGDLWGVAQSGAAMDLTSYLDANGSEWRNQMYSYIPDLLSWDGKVYGIAASLNNLQLLVNKGLLDEQKLTTPETTDDLIKMAKDLKNSGIAPIAFGTADLWTQIDLFTVFVHQQGGGAELRKADMGEIKWSGNPIFIKAMEAIKQLNDAGVFLSGASAMNYHEDAFPVWMQGKTAMLWPGGNFMVQDITEDVKAEAIWFPTMPGGKKILTGGTALVWCASSTTKYPDLAVDLLKELTTQQTYGLMFENGVAPAGKLEKEVSSKYPLADKINKEQGDALDRFIYTPETNKEVAIAVQALMAGDVNASGAIDMIQKASDTAYKK